MKNHAADPAERSPAVTLDVGHVVEQLARALARGQDDKARRWALVFRGLLGGELAVGTRTPVEGAPAWATLEVASGGFATGALLAGGPLRPHERALASRVCPGEDAPSRAALNLHYLSAAGREELLEMLRSGRFRVEVPEEGALLTAVWLLEHDRLEAAQGLLETIAPFFDRLRFYPVPHPRPLVAGAAVRRQPIEETIRDLEASSPHARVLEMNEALAVWAPLYDRAVALFRETVRDDWPCRVYPPGWLERAKRLMDDYARLRAAHRRSHKPEKRKANFTRLRGYLALAIESPNALTGRDVGMIRAVLAGHAARYGERLEELRAEQAAMAARPTHAELRAVAIDRLARLGDEGLTSLVAFTDMPTSIAKKLRRSLEAPIEELVEQRVLTSAESLARVLPQLTSHIRAAGLADADLRRVYAAVYAAFRRRRSLLLLNLERQVRVEELPWVAAMNVVRDAAGTGAEEAAHESLRQLSSLAVSAFPATLLPNKLVRELRALASSAKLDLPLVDELAADIFMGTFTVRFLHAAKSAARLLRGTLYERYYGLPYDEVLAIDDAQRSGRSAEVSPAFAALCARLATGSQAGGRVAFNGTILEQEQILTTHNLAPLFAEVNLGRDLAGELPALARACFSWVCKDQRQARTTRRAALRAVKNAAYAWRHMLFLLSVGAEPPAEFMAWAYARFAEQAETFRSRWYPALRGLEHVVGGGRFGADGTCPGGGRRLLGWTTGPHWALESAPRLADRLPSNA